MTTAIWSYKHNTLGADNQCGGWVEVGKIFPLADGSYLTGAGFYDDIVEVAAWLAAGAKEEDKPSLGSRGDDDSDFIYVGKDGTAYWLTCPFLRKVRIVNKYYAIGSGGAFALGALEAGATVEQALAIAAKYDPHTGKTNRTVEIKKAPTPKRRGSKVS